MKGFIMKSIAYTIIALLLSACLATATIIHVPGDYQTIQAGINAALNGDTVLVADGTYTGLGNKNIDFGGRAILVISENGPESCIIDCENSGRGFDFHSNETSASILSGFKITNGSADKGGGIRLGLYESSNPTIVNCIISGNSTTSDWGYGGGIYCTDSNPTIVNCTISDNSASAPGYWGHGGGIYLDDSSPIISYCTINGNTASGSWGYGGGIHCSYSSNPTIDHCTISGNSGAGTWGYGGGIYCGYTSNPNIINCTISGNSVSGNWHSGGGVYCYNSSPSIVNTIVEGSIGNGGGIYFDGSPNATVSYSDFYNNSGGNFTGSVPAGLGTIVGTNANGDPCDSFYSIFLNPLFVDPINGNFNLQANSPCIDAGDPTSPSDPDFTLADMGAFYYNQGITPSLDVTLTPQNPPIQIPAGGGSFQFDISIANNGAIGVVFDAWTMVVLPDSTIFGPLIIRNGLFLAAGGSILREDMTQFVPAAAPSGDYSYIANVGIYPANVVDSDFFPFEKLPGYDASNHDYGWSVYGWDGEEAPLITTPTEFTLYPAYPNPFNPMTNLSFSLPEAGDVMLVVYDIQGREVARLVNGFYPTGTHESVFNGSELASGVYFASLTSGGFQLTQKIILIK